MPGNRQKAGQVDDHRLGSHPAQCWTYPHETQESDKALPAYLKCLEIDEKLNGRNSVDTAETLKCIGGVYNGMGDYN